MDDEAGAGSAVKWARVNESVRWSDALAGRIVARVRAGESVRAMAREAGYPRPETVTRWGRERPEFRAAIVAARDAAGCPFRGGVSTYCAETAEAIWRRVCEGEGLAAICRDAEMPARATVWNWRQAHPEFDKAMDQARELQADWVFDFGWRMMMEATAETAYLAKVRLGHLRWHAGKLAPRRFGTLKATEPAGGEAGGGGAGGGVTNVYMRTFRIDPITWESRPDERREPELLYSVAADGTVSKPAPDPEVEAAKAQKQADFRRAFGEAGRASLDAGVTPNGFAEPRFWPEWWKAAYPEDWEDQVNSHAAQALRLAERRARFSGMDPRVSGASAQEGGG